MRSVNQSSGAEVENLCLLERARRRVVTYRSQIRTRQPNADGHIIREKAISYILYTNEYFVRMYCIKVHFIQRYIMYSYVFINTSA